MEITPEMQEVIDIQVAEASKNVQEAALATAQHDVEEQLKQIEQEKDSIISNRDSVLAEKKALQEQLKSFDGLNAEELKKLKKMVDESEESELLQQGRFDEIVNRRTEKMRLSHEEELITIQTDYDALKKKESNVSSAFDQYKIQLAINNAASLSGALPTAIPDIVNRSTNMFSLDTDGQIYARDEEGNIRKDKSGKALDPTQYVSNLQNEAPHFWPASKSANLKGAKPSEIEDKLSSAVATGDMAAYRKLRASMKG
ncbi:MAG: hypothetical protein DRH08_04235 [Deltaproteobacteria bacterium]|nr:MAG: hypothetical protein DRH08_04235 [Deltaproteobacteria bacterium]